MDRFQQSQRVLEVRKKVEMYENEWMQTVKAENKLQPIQMQKDMLEGEETMFNVKKKNDAEEEEGAE